VAYGTGFADASQQVARLNADGDALKPRRLNCSQLN
jgi:hypothetical protein